MDKTGAEKFVACLSKRTQAISELHGLRFREVQLSESKGPFQEYYNGRAVYTGEISYDIRSMFGRTLILSIQGKSFDLDVAEVGEVTIQAQQIDRSGEWLEPLPDCIVSTQIFDTRKRFREDMTRLLVNPDEWKYNDREDRIAVNADIAALYAEKILLPDLLDRLHSSSFLGKSLAFPRVRSQRSDHIQVVLADASQIDRLHRRLAVIIRMATLGDSNASVSRIRVMSVDDELIGYIYSGQPSRLADQGVTVLDRFLSERGLLTGWISKLRKDDTQHVAVQFEIADDYWTQLDTQVDDW